MDVWARGREEAVDPIDAQLALAHLRAALGLGRARPARITQRYELRELIGAGAYGRVYRGWDSKLQRPVALKRIPLHSAHAAEQARGAALTEAQTLARLSHPNIVGVFDVFVSPSASEGAALVVVMALVDGVDLAVWHDREPRSLGEVVDVYSQLGRGLAAAHEQGIVHRDFKPANAMVRRDGRALVLDFGVATVGTQTLASAGLATSTTQRERFVVGTPAYMAPEQHEGEPATVQSDVYAFGVTLHEGLYGRRPFDATTVQALRDQKRRGPPARGPRGPASQRIYRVVRKALQPRVSDRWESISAMTGALQAAARPRRTGWILVGSLGTVALAALWQSPGKGPGHTCVATAASIHDDWDTRREALQRALVDGAVSPSAQAATAERLNTFVDDWARAAAESCRRSDVGSALPGTGACLTSARGAWMTWVDATIASHQPAQLAVSGLDALPQLAECHDEELALRQGLPADPRAREELTALTVWANQVVAGATPDEDELKERIRRADALGHEPTRAAVWGAVGSQRGRQQRPEDALSAWKEAYTAAMAGGAERSALAAAVSASAGAAALHDVQQAEHWSRAAIALCDRLGDTEGSRAAALNNIALAYTKAGRSAEARSLADRALAIAPRDTARAKLARIHMLLTSAAAAADAPGGREASVVFSEQAFELAASNFPDDPALSERTGQHLAGAYHNAGRTDEAERLFRELIDNARDDRGRWGASLSLATVLSSHPQRREEALALAVGVERDMREKAATDQPMYGNARRVSGNLLFHLGRHRKAADALRGARDSLLGIVEPGHPWLESIDRRLTEISQKPLSTDRPGAEDE